MVGFAAVEVEPGVRIHYRHVGKGTATMLLIHGYPETLLAWRHIVEPLLDAEFTLVMPDLRGAGNSSRPLSGYDKKNLARDCMSVLAHAGITYPVTVVGHDIGAMVAYAFSRQFPDNTARLAIIDAPLPGTATFDAVGQNSQRGWHFHFHQARDLPEALTAGREAFYLERWYHDYAYNPEAIDRETFEAYCRAFAQPGGMRAGFELYRSFDLDTADNRKWLKDQGKLRMPVLAVSGSIGPYVTSLGEMMSDLAQNVSAITVPESGHWVAEENPEALSTALIDFVSQQ